jgi:SagB-type dehydrogenase family enzyme
MPTDRTGVFDYHKATKHHLTGYALGPGRLDWATQPDPFRRYVGARLVPLARPAEDAGPAFDDVARLAVVPPAPLDASWVSSLFYDSLAISAWKQAGLSKWALRVNPSSGNLHPTEGYLVAGPVAGLLERPSICHYAPREHALEVRAELDDATWRALAAGFPPDTVFVGLTSIHWRESWKYGERAYRYCQHDAGHAIAAVALAASALGRRTLLLDGLGTRELADLLGVADPRGAEAEHPECVLALHVPGEVPDRVDAVAVARVGESEWRGRPNALSPTRMPWPIIEAAAAAADKPAGPVERWWAPPSADARPARALAFRRTARTRRSAVAFDGRTTISSDAFFQMLARTMPCASTAALAPLWWRPRVHFALFVHRVDGLDPGLYLLARDPSAADRLRASIDPEYGWERPVGCPDALPLVGLAAGDARRVARQVSCHQDIAADGAFSLGMVAEFAEPIERVGHWFYPRLFWETGAIGQILYLEAEAAGVRATGIGCYFDDAVHEVFGFEGTAFQSLYHFTVGGPLEDTRITTLPAYGER